MSVNEQIHEGMQVYGTDDQPIGTIEKKERDAILVNGERIPSSAIDSVVKNRVYVKTGNMARGQSGAGTVKSEGEIHVPVREERLNVQKREAELGEVRIRTTVDQEQVTIPVELRHEEVHVEQHNFKDRPLQAGEMADAFKEGTIRVPVMGEEAIVTKEAIVTGEVVVEKGQVVEHQEVRDTVRRERVTIDENFQKGRAAFQQHFQQRHKAWGGRPATFEEAEGHYRTGYEAASDERYAGMTFDQIEPDLRDQSGMSARERANDWQHLRERIREGWEQARRT